MKQFELDGLQYECEDKYNFFAKDKDRRVWVYVNKPICNAIAEGEDWDDPANGYISEVQPIVSGSINWKQSLGEI